MEAIRLLHEYHIDSFRRSRETGRITEIDHIQFGWITPERYYQLQKLHDAIPLFTKIMEGGYRLKAQLWQSEIRVTVLGSGTTFPLGYAIFGAAIGLYALDTLAGKTLDAALDVAALFLPFGELWYLFRGAIVISELADFLEDVVEGAGGVLGEVAGTVEDAQQALQDILSGIPPNVPGGPLPPM